MDVVILLELYTFVAVIAKGSDMTNFQLSRRGFLIGTGATLLLTTIYTGYRQYGSYPTHDLSVSNLSDKEVHLYRILGNWLLPPSKEIPGSGGDNESILAIDQMFKNVPEGKRFLLSALPLAFEHGTILSALGATSLSQMHHEEQSKYLNAWSNSNNLIEAQLMAAMKTIFGFSYFEREEVLEAIQLSSFCKSMV